MCGFVGFTNSGKLDNAKEVLNSMMDKIIHRGPDSKGEYIDDYVSLGFRRLSIIDLKQGDQPIFNENRSIAIVFNGEIYNYKILKEELEEKGHYFRTRTDTEVLVHSYEEYGEGFVKKLRGMFSFVIWDMENKKMFGARDFFGIKPFYYAAMGNTLIFGSEIKSFLPHPEFKKEMNREALENYLTFQYSPLTETFFKGVYKLPPAHYFTFANGEMRIKRYWEPKFEADDDKDLHYWTTAISRGFINSVEAHKVSDVEVGSFLSSGIDSSYVACCANVNKTFTVGFDDRQYNEISYAKSLSKYISVENISKVITPDEFWSALPKIQYHMDEPLADPAAVALYFVCNLASDYVKVVLSGEGADEIFGGYNIYKEPIDRTFYDNIPFFIRRIISKIASRMESKRGVNFLVRKGKRVEEKFIGNAYIFSEKERKELLKNPVNAPPPQNICRPFYDRVADKDDVTKMQYLDLHLWMCGDILLKADKMSMANSLELRVPFLDREIMDLAGRIPVRYRVNDMNTKFALRKAALKRMPPQVANKKKLGFPVPIRVWLKDEKYYRIVRKAFKSEVSAEFFDANKLVALLDEHMDGVKDNSRKIWTVFTFLIWYAQYFI